MPKIPVYLISLLLTALLAYWLTVSQYVAHRVAKNFLTDYQVATF